MCQRAIIVRTPNEYHVFDDGKIYKVKNHDVEPLLRRMNFLQLKKFLEAGCSIRTYKLNNDDYILRSFVPGKGGGVGSATTGVAVGHFLGNMVVFSGIGIISLGAIGVGFFVGGPIVAALFGGATAKSLTVTIVPLSQPFIHTVAITGGLMGGIFSGPV